jgi:hypothetical protein
MKKLLAGLVLISAVFSGNLFAKQVVFCSGYFIGANEKMKCHGDLEGQYTPLQLYHKGWILRTDISRADAFVLVFEK